MFSCTCPVGADGSFCKHAVALALVAAEPRSTLQQPDIEADVDVRAYLEGLAHERLVDLVLEIASADELAVARLRLDAAKASSGPPSLRAFLDVIDGAFETDDYVSYREAYDYAARIREVIGAMRGLLDAEAEAVITLCEHALERAEDAIGSVDDSNGCLGGIAAELQELHLAACKKACPDPVALAHRLFDWECSAGDLDVFSGAAHTYAKVLGKTGLATYRQLAEAAWERLPALGSGDKRSYDGTRFRITHMMEALAEASGDVDAVVAVLAKDQSSPYDFVRIAERYRAAGRFSFEEHCGHIGPNLCVIFRGYVRSSMLATAIRGDMPGSDRKSPYAAKIGSSRGQSRTVPIRS